MNVYEVVTVRILDALDSGVVPWRKPWSVNTPRNLASGREYRGVNVVLLQSAPHQSPYWLTFNQAKARGGAIRRGQRGCPVIFWKVGEKERPNGKTEKTFLLRYFTVFNVEQTEGIEVPVAPERTAFDPIAECEKVLPSYVDPPRIEHAGGQACYLPATDLIRMPPAEAFDSSVSYYATLFHELIHSTGAASRLSRKGVIDPTRFGSHTYAFEELVAECGAAFLSAHAGIAPMTLDSSAAYIRSWARSLRQNPRWMVEAAAQATKAADLVLGNSNGMNAQAEQDAEAA